MTYPRQIADILGALHGMTVRGARVRDNDSLIFDLQSPSGEVTVVRVFSIAWRVETAEQMLVGADDNAAELPRMVHVLNEATITDISVSWPSLDTTHTYFVSVEGTSVLVHNVRGKGLRPDYDAVGEHTTFVRDGTTGQVKKWATWRPQTNPNNPAPWEMVERYDLQGPAHTNKNGDVIPTPHINSPNGGDARPAEPWEIPGSGASCPI